jgi:DNA-binding Lrp family transcriptional regulator
MLTKNEKTILRILLASFDTHNSINNLAKQAGINPNGALKILRKFEKEGILKSIKIANIKSYKIDFQNEKTELILELAFMPELEGRVKYRREDLKELESAAACAIMFGSYTGQKKEPNDMDVLFVLEKEKYKEYKKKIEEIKELLPVKLHEILQTERDLKNNILKKDKIILEAIKSGIVLWGNKTIIKVMKDVYPGKA